MKKITKKEFLKQCREVDRLKDQIGFNRMMELANSPELIARIIKAQTTVLSYLSNKYST